MQARIDKGYTALKMDMGEDIPGAVINDPTGDLQSYKYGKKGYNLTEHPFTRVQITEK